MPIGPQPRLPYDDEADRYRMRCSARLLAAHKAADISTHELAHRARIPNGSIISRYETEGVLPTPRRMLALAAALEVDPDHIWCFGLLDGETTPEEDT